MKSADQILTQAVSSLSGVGVLSALRFEKLGLYTIQDLLFHLPKRYEDRTRVQAINMLSVGMKTLVCGTIDHTDITRRGRGSLICRISDPTGHLTLKFFHFSTRQHRSLKPGLSICCFGEIRQGLQGFEIIHPEYKFVDLDKPVTEKYLTPVYPLTEGLKQHTIRQAIEQALALCVRNPPLLPEYLPPWLLKDKHFPEINQALLDLHQPEQVDHQPALKRLAFEELLAHHLALLENKKIVQQWQAPVFKIDKRVCNKFIQALPFTLTQAQQRVIKEVQQDCCRDRPMIRLIQGDVGSGKTIIAAYAALLAISNQLQVALMAPTELLAEQHRSNFNRWFQHHTVNIVFLTGQIKGRARKAAMQAIESGAGQIIIGTHALFQDNLRFHQLGLIIIDEQHRFGVHQRLALREKGQIQHRRPHQLVMTATPIPRTLAMLYYSDLDISIIDQLPPGRKPVITRVMSAQRREQVIEKINQWIHQQHQIYWVCTLIDESDVVQCEAAEKTAAYLTEALPDARIALVHGRMKGGEKEHIMNAFKQHQYDLLVATTVIEVGVDVPNANLMIIENAERLGLSQLHQLRGRVGRGQQESYCLLLYQPPLSETSRYRLGVIRENHDGFVIAEQDLVLRGSGDVMGTRQTGQIALKIADLERDAKLLDDVHHVAQMLYQRTPQNIKPLIQRWLGQSAHYAEV